jgi:hypothetical protein
MLEVEAVSQTCTTYYLFNSTVTGRLNARRPKHVAVIDGNPEPDLVGYVVAGQTHFRLLNNIMQKSYVPPLVETLAIAMIQRSKQHTTMEKTFPI